MTDFTTVFHKGKPIGLLIKVEDGEFLHREYPAGIVPVWSVMADGLILTPVPDPVTGEMFVFADPDVLLRRVIGDADAAGELADRVEQHLAEFASHDAAEDARVAQMSKADRQQELASLTSAVHLSAAEIADAMVRLR